MARSGWGFDIDNAAVFQKTLPESPPWLVSAELLLLQERYTEAKVEAESALQVAKRSNNMVSQGLALHLLARASSTQNRSEEAKSFAGEARAAFLAANDAKGAAGSSLLSARLAMNVKENLEAQRLVAEVLTEYEALESLPGQAAAQHLLARILAREDRIEDALEAADKAFQLFQQAEDKEGQAAALLVKGNMYVWNYADAMDEALKVGRQAVTLCRHVTGRPSCRIRQADGLFLCGFAALELNRTRDGLKSSEDALKIFVEVGGPRSQASALRAVALSEAAIKKYDKAQEAIERALGLLKSLDTQDEALLAEVLATESYLAKQVYFAALSTSQKKSGSSEKQQQQQTQEKTKEQEEKTTEQKEGEEKEKEQQDEEEDKQLKSLQEAMVEKARVALDAVLRTEDEATASLRRLELGEALYSSGDAAGALTESTMALEYMKEKGLGRFQGQAMLTVAVCRLATGDPKGALELAREAEKAAKDSTTLQALAEVISIAKPMAAQLGGKTSADPGSYYAQLENPTVRFEVHKEYEEGGVKKTTYSDLINMRIHCGDTPEPISFDTPGIFYMDQFLGVAMPFLPYKKPPIPGVHPQGLDLTSQIPLTVPASKSSAKTASADRLKPMLPRPESEKSESQTDADAGPRVIKAAAVGTSDLLGGRYRDCPEAMHERMVALAKAGILPTTTLTQRQILERKRPTFQGHKEWKEAVRWGYLHPTLAAPKGCMWQKASIGYKLVGPSPTELLERHY
mmetsp:Transcript_48760/g.105028  ORF Transcript_48760/g.105028 Transcript_48760/m.105028 type:complete len:745 (+) Transcript_48760:166-2400(+)|eukprot:CAMPEP_0206487388 /NCGR_PEP_ID=MMETSP0324_2-20121206/41611_1 /ASSEMBLY_ACC=CAM_ASM_000836 /TAXON_ID=2866 /ORGANISM="Crypthecodinium cohnii, Strain Seligo" /LENGTH=744 /DNA_ID=CAMNT_0053965859 /DNA_START=76 /DNA_END=2310 /DNA_ORIENTATION=+